MHCMGIRTTGHWQTSGRLVKESNVGNVCPSIPFLYICITMSMQQVPHIGQVFFMFFSLVGAKIFSINGLKKNIFGSTTDRRTIRYHLEC